MKKIHVVRKDEESIEGYEKVEITPEGINMTAISQNECSLILASDIVDAIPTHDVPNALGLFASKLRIGGSLVTGGFDINLNYDKKFKNPKQKLTSYARFSDGLNEGLNEYYSTDNGGSAENK